MTCHNQILILIFVVGIIALSVIYALYQINRIKEHSKNFKTKKKINGKVS